MKTDKRIKAEITKLKKMRPSVRQYTFFGDDNWEVIDAQVQALTENMDRDFVYDNFSDEEKEDNRVLDGALEAVDWVADEPDSEAPSDSWATLVVK